MRLGVWTRKRLGCSPATLGIGVLAVLPVLISVILWGLGQGGPTLVYQDARFPLSPGIGKCSPRTWQTMQTPGQIVRCDGFWDRFWGGLNGMHGDLLVATGPDFVAVARCSAPGSQHGGRVRGWITIPHGRLFVHSLLTAIVLFGVLRLLLAIARKVRAEWFVPAGHCIRCGYNLRGLSEPRCPECGCPFEPTPSSGAAKTATVQAPTECNADAGFFWFK